MNQLTLGDPVIFAARNPEELILYGSLASKEEDQDPIDLAVLAGLKDKAALQGYTQVQFVPFDPVHKKTESTITDAKNRTFKGEMSSPRHQTFLRVLKYCTHPFCSIKERSSTGTASR